MRKLIETIYRCKWSILRLLIEIKIQIKININISIKIKIKING